MEIYILSVIFVMFLFVLIKAPHTQNIHEKLRLDSELNNILDKINQMKKDYRIGVDEPGYIGELGVMGNVVFTFGIDYEKSKQHQKLFYDISLELHKKLVEVNEQVRNVHHMYVDGLINETDAETEGNKIMNKFNLIKNDIYKELDHVFDKYNESEISQGEYLELIDKICERIKTYS